MVLVKLRQNKTNQELGTLFGVTEKDIYNVFVTWVRFMSPVERNQSVAKERVSFYYLYNFGDNCNNTRVIVGATECPVQHPGFL